MEERYLQETGDVRVVGGYHGDAEYSEGDGGGSSFDGGAADNAMRREACASEGSKPSVVTPHWLSKFEGRTCPGPGEERPWISRVVGCGATAAARVSGSI